MKCSSLHTLSAFFTLFIACSVFFTLAASAACPPAAIASESTSVDTLYGTVAVEACVTRSSGQDTYTYRLTYLGGPLDNPCGLLVAGQGPLDTVSMAAPTGWLSSDHETSACGSWWTWSKPTFGADLGSTLLVRTLTMSVTVDGETAPVSVPAAISFCAKAAVPFMTLGPAAIGTDTEFVGAGPRIQVLGPATGQVTAVCEPSWVRHGFTYQGLDPDSVLFQLFIDGIEIPLTRQVICFPLAEAGRETVRVWFYRQFAAEELTVGLHEVTGVWTMDATASPPDGFRFERTISLLVEECAPEPIPASLPDLRVALDPDTCGCGWNEQQEYNCFVSMKITVTNEGGASSGATGVILRIGQQAAVTAIPELQPGQSYERTVDVTVGSSPGRAPCPLKITAQVDSANEIEELNEDNNTAEAESCCQ